jgi:hypothetical protein
MRLATICLLVMGVGGTAAPATPAALATPAAPSEVQDIQAHVMAVLTATVEAREKEFQRPGARPRRPRPWTQYVRVAHPTEPDLRALVALATDRKLPESQASLYREAVESALSSPDSRLRGLAAQVLRVIHDERSIPKLGALLDDNEASTPAVTGRVVRTGGLHKTLVAATVGEAARWALRTLTNTAFHHRSDFDAWWRVNRERPEEKLWYWAARWSNRQRNRRRPYVRSVTDWREATERRPWPPPGPPAAWEAVGEDRKADLEALARLPGDTGLKVLLLAHNPYALQAEAQASVGDPITPSPARVYAAGGPSLHGAPSTANAAAYVTRYHLQARLMELLRGRDLYPEVSAPRGQPQGEVLPDMRGRPGDQWMRMSLLHWRFLQSGPPQTPAAAQQELVIEIARVAQWVFTAQDEPAVAEIMRTRTDQRTRVVLALLRSRIAPARGHEILRDELQAHPEWTTLARQLIRRYGAVDAEALRLACTGNRLAQDAVTRDIFFSATTRPVSPQALAAVIETVQPPGPLQLCGCKTLRRLAYTANRAMNRSIISGEEIASLGGWVPGVEEDTRARQARLDKAVPAVKAKLLAALQAYSHARQKGGLSPDTPFPPHP